ncbi:MAG: hypothetical protein ACRCYQ_13495 [Nocardioides sp.]
MASPRRAGPPRPLDVGDIVVRFSDLLGEWTAAQITDVKHEWKEVAVLELDWSGPEATGVHDLGDVEPLRYPFKKNGQWCVHSYCGWVLPRSFRIIGRLPPLTSERTTTGGTGWRLGDSLWKSRLWHSGVREKTQKRGSLHLRGPEARDLPTRTPDPAIRILDIYGDIGDLDANLVADLFPGLVELHISGDLGTLRNARTLGRLTSLRELMLYEVFGMTADDVVTPAEIGELEYIWLQGIPREYSAAMSKLWRPEAVNGTFLQIYEARRPDWIAENRDSPLRDWDGREELRPSVVKKAFEQCKTTRREVIELVKTGAGTDAITGRLAGIGAEYAEAFNALDARWMFIETEERDELLEVLGHIAREAAAEAGLAAGDLERALLRAANDARDW